MVEVYEGLSGEVNFGGALLKTERNKKIINHAHRSNIYPRNH